MIYTDTVHVEPSFGETVSPCCGLQLSQLPRTDWLSRNEEDVTCGRLTDRDIELLLGGAPAAPIGSASRDAGPATEQFIFELTNRVRAVCRTTRHCNYRSGTAPIWR